MAEKKMSVRLAAVGGRQVRAELVGIGEAGTKGFGRLSREAQKVNDRLAGFARDAKSAARSADVISKEMDRLRAKYDPLFRSSKQYETELEELNRAQKIGALSTEQYGAALTRLNAEYDTTGREIDRLRAKYDPLFRSSRQYEAELEELNRAQKLGALNTEQYDAALVRLNAQYQRGSVAAARMGQASKSALFRTQGMGGGIQNVAYQVGDFAVQVGAGTSAARALGLQLPQLLGGFGVVGAVAGAAVAVMVPLIGAFVSGGDEAKSFADTLKDLEGALGDYQRAVKDSQLTTDEMIAKYGDLSDAMRRVKDALVDIGRVDTLRGLRDAARKVTTPFNSLDKNSFIDPFTHSKAYYDRDFMEKYGENGTLRVSEAFRELIQNFDIPAESALKLTDALRTLKDAEDLKDIIHAAQDLDSIFLNIFGSFEKMQPEIAEAYKELRKLEDAAGEFYTRMINGEARLAASRLAQSAQTDLKTSEINWQFRDDPIEKAKALAGLKYDQAVEKYTAGKLDDETLNILNQTKEEFVATAGAIAEKTQRLREWERHQRDSGNSASSTAKNLLKFTQSFDKQNVALARQIGLLGKTGPRIAALQEKWRLLDQAKQNGIDINSKLAGSMMTVGAQIDAQAQKIGSLTAQLELFTRNRALVEGFGQSLVTSLSRARDFEDVLGSLGNALENIGQKLVEAALNMAIFGNATGSLQGGSGLLGSLLSAVFGDSFSSVFGGGMADGGAVHAATGGRIDASGGGRLSGPGGPRGDKIAAWLSAGEYVVNAISAKKYAPLLDAINSDAFDIARNMADGGAVHNAPVSPPPMQTLRTIRSRASVTNTVTFGDINVNVPEGTDPQDAATIGREVRRQIEVMIDERLQDNFRARGLFAKGAF